MSDKGLIADERQLELFASTRQHQQRITPAVRGVLAETATTGLIRYPWSLLQPVVASLLHTVLQDFDAEARVDVGPQLPLPGAASLPELQQRLQGHLKAFQEAPFTLQRLCEVLLEPHKQYARLPKLAQAIERLLLVTTEVPPCSDPPPRPSIASLGPVNEGMVGRQKRKAGRDGVEDAEEPPRKAPRPTPAAGRRPGSPPRQATEPLAPRPTSPTSKPAPPAMPGAGGTAAAAGRPTDDVRPGSEAAQAAAAAESLANGPSLVGSEAPAAEGLPHQAAAPEQRLPSGTKRPASPEQPAGLSAALPLQADTASDPPPKRPRGADEGLGSQNGGMLMVQQPSMNGIAHGGQGLRKSPNREGRVPAQQHLLDDERLASDGLTPDSGAAIKHELPSIAT